MYVFFVFFMLLKNNTQVDSAHLNKCEKLWFHKPSAKYCLQLIICGLNGVQCFLRDETWKPETLASVESYYLLRKKDYNFMDLMDLIWFVNFHATSNGAAENSSVKETLPAVTRY